MQHEPFEVVHRLSAAISQAADLETIYSILLETIVEVMDVERASIMRYDPQKQVLKIVAAKGIDPEVWKKMEIAVGEGVSGQVWRRGRPVLIGNVKFNPRYKTHSYLIAPVTAFPMKVGEVPIGLINLTDKRSGDPFTEEDLKLLMTISEQVASYMHLSDLMLQLESAKKDRIQLEMARSIQQKLLPQKAPKIPGLEIDGCLIPAERVGADYYDYFSLPTGLGLCVADVSGHNVAGALLAFAFRACLQAEALKKDSPKKVVETINEALFADLLRSEQFISLFYAQYDPLLKKLKFTNAGHNPPLLWRAREGKAEWLFTHDSLLGIEKKLDFHEKELLLEPGDTLILYTDGLTEAQNEKGDRFGSQRLLEFLSRGSQNSASEMLKVLLSHWKAFRNGGSPKDDVTLVIAKAVA